MVRFLTLVVLVIIAAKVAAIEEHLVASTEK